MTAENRTLHDPTNDFARFLQPVEAQSRDLAVLERLAAMIGHARMRPGDRLPAERVLAERLAVGRSTVREALTRWAALGVVERRKGSGTYLLTTVDPETRHVPVAIQFEREALRRMVEVRRALELEVVALACARASAAELAVVAERFAALDAIHARVGASPSHDRAFHQAIYDCAHNVVFGHLIGQLQACLRWRLHRAVRGQELWRRELPHPSRPRRRRGRARCRCRARGHRPHSRRSLGRTGRYGRRHDGRANHRDWHGCTEGPHAVAMETLLTHDEGLPYGAVVPPIVQTSLFTFDSYRAMEDRFHERSQRHIYSRGDNPTVQAFEEKVRLAEGGTAVRGVASGMAAISAAVLAHVASGDRIVCTRHVYPDAYRLFEKLCRRFGIAIDYVDGGDPDAVAAALPGARLLYLESPTSLTFETQDLARLAELARAHGVTSIVDNSWATPIFQRPLAHGIDIVVHSASKYLSGHSDTVAGVIVTDHAHMAPIKTLTLPLLGPKLSPFEGWLLLRGMRTLSLRMARHQDSAAKLAARLRDHPRVTRVALPGPASSASLTGHSGLFSFEVDGVRRHPRLLRRVAAVPARRQLGRAREPGISGADRPRADGRTGQFPDRLRRVGSPDTPQRRPGGGRRPVGRYRACAVGRGDRTSTGAARQEAGQPRRIVR